jgi:N-acyl-D-amino-acid deacylase
MAAAPTTPAESYDLVIRGGRVMDGTGNPWISADIAVRGGKIIRIGVLPPYKAIQTVNAEGRLVVPGFIDMHSHADDRDMGTKALRAPDPRRRAAPNLVAQGITTVLVNPDGDSPEMSIQEQAAALEHAHTGVNVALLVGHNTIRRDVMGTDSHRLARPDEVRRMRDLLRAGLMQGAFGLSAGLEYEPGRWSDTEELIQLARELPAFRGIYTVHMRSEASAPVWWRPSQSTGPEGPSLLEAVRETIRIGEESGATVVATHLKARGTSTWHAAREVVALINQARSRGVSVYGDQYTYNTSFSDGFVLLLPNWSLGLPPNQPEDRRPPGNYASKLTAILSDPQQHNELIRDIAHEIDFRGGAQNIRIVAAVRADWVGRSLAELARRNQVSPIEMAIRLQLDGDHRKAGGVLARAFSLSEDDVQTFMSQPWVATSTDADIVLPEDGPAHPRFYGNYIRKIERYAFHSGPCRWRPLSVRRPACRRKFCTFRIAGDSNPAMRRTSWSSTCKRCMTALPLGTRMNSRRVLNTCSSMARP